MLKELQKFFDHACKPAQFWMVLGAISIVTPLILVFIINRIKPNEIAGNIFVFILVVLYVLGIGWIFNWLCRNNMTGLSWALVLLPYVLLLLQGVIVLFQTGNVANKDVMGGMIAAIIIAIAFSMMNGKK